MLGRFVHTLHLFQLNASGEGLLQLVVFQLQLTLKVHHIRGFRRQQIDQITTEYIFLVQFFIEHTGNLRNVVIPLNERTDFSTKLIASLLIEFVILISHRL